MSALRETIFESSRGEYSSSRSTTPNRSRKGAESCPALVVAPTRVNRGRGRWYEAAICPLPVMMSRAKSSMAG